MRLHTNDECDTRLVLSGRSSFVFSHRKKCYPISILLLPN